MWATLTQLCAAWSAIYLDSPVLRTLVSFAHVGALVVGGGCAIAADRAILRAGRAHEGQVSHGPDASVHTVVIGSLLVVFASGGLLLAADLESYLQSWLFWTKMALVAALLVNGVWLRRTERDLAVRPDRVRRLRRAARWSVVLWIVTTFAGTALANL
jgi:hypothetical protein